MQILPVVNVLGLPVSNNFAAILCFEVKKINFNFEF